MNKIFLSSPHMEKNGILYATNAYKKNHVFPLGEYLNKFEQIICDYTKSKYCLAVSSGTAAIHLALIALNVKENDEVICSSFTFSASANPILYLKAKPVFVDSEKSTWNMSPELLEFSINDRIKKTGKKPKAIILVHLYGMPSKIDEIITIASKFQIPVIEDAAEALGSTYRGKQVGTFGDIGIFSFNGNKIITTSGGGALISKKKQLIKDSFKRATQSREPVRHYEHNEIGYNYRLSNISAAIGCGQFEVLEKHVKFRRDVYNRYVKNFKLIKELSFFDEPSSIFKSNRWLSTFIFKGIPINDLIIYLEKYEIESRNLWKPLHLQPVFSNFPKYINGDSENLFDSGICLPSSSNLRIDEQNFVIEKVLKFIHERVY